MAQTNGNGARIEGKIAGQTVSIVTKDVISVLLLVGIFVMGYLSKKDLDHRIDLLHAHHVRIYEWLIQDQQLQRDERQSIQRMLLTHEHNQDKAPEQRLPLELTPPTVPAPRPPLP